VQAASRRLAEVLCSRRLINLALRAAYLKGQSFDLPSYIRDTQLADVSRYPAGVQPIVGNLYLTENVNKFLSTLRDRLGENSEKDLSACWLAPDVSFWGRTRRVRPLVNELNKALTRKRNADVGESEDPLQERRAPTRVLFPSSRVVDGEDRGGLSR
jgi:hypothetical protein